MQTSLTTRMVLTACVALAAAGAVACSQGGAGGTSDATALGADVTRQWSEALAAGNASQLAALYTEDARSLPPGGPAIAGRAPIEEYWRSDIGAGGAKTTLTPANAFVDGDVLYTEGTYVVAEGGAPLAQGQYQQLWTQSDGAWRVHREMWRLDPALQRSSELADQLTGRWTAAYNAGDAAKLGALYAEDAALSTAADGTFSERERIEAFWARDFGGGKPVSTLTISDVYAAGDLTHLEGEFSVVDEGKTTDGRYIQLWMRDGSDWRIHREMWWR